MKGIQQHPEVEDEIQSQVLFYDERSIWTSDRLLEDIQQALLKIQRDPRSCHFVYETYRRCNLTRFPHHFIYLEKADVHFIILFAHDKRNPDYWKTRISEDPT